MKNKLFTLGFTVALILDIIAIGLIGFLTYASFFLDFGDYQSKFQFIVVVYILLAIYNSKLVYSDCKKKDNDSALMRGIIYGLIGPLGWQIYYSEYYQKPKNGYFEYKEVKETNLPLPISKPVGWVIMIVVILYVLTISYFVIRNSIRSSDYMGAFFLALFIIFIVVYTYFNSRSAKLERKNPLDKDAGKLASYLVLVFFVAAIAFIFFYAKYLVK